MRSTMVFWLQLAAKYDSLLRLRGVSAFDNNADHSHEIKASSEIPVGIGEVSHPSRIQDGVARACCRPLPRTTDLPYTSQTPLNSPSEKMTGIMFTQTLSNRALHLMLLHAPRTAVASRRRIGSTRRCGHRGAADRWQLPQQF